MQTALDIFGTTDFDHLEGSSDGEDEFLADLSPEELREERFKALKKAFEPSELKDKFATEEDEDIRSIDIPERIQLRMPRR
jgi:transcription elongation factor SPT6